MAIICIFSYYLMTCIYLDICMPVFMPITSIFNLLTFSFPPLICLFPPFSFRCVRLARFENDRTISFIPPDGSFDLMTYRLGTQVCTMSYVSHTVCKYFLLQLVLLVIWCYVHRLLVMRVDKMQSFHPIIFYVLFDIF